MQKSIFWLFAGPAWPLKIIIAIIAPIILIGSTLAAIPWAALFLLLPAVTLVAGKPAIAAQQALLAVALPTLFTYLQQLVGMLHAAITGQGMPALDLWQMTERIPGHLLYYAAPGGDPLQWAGRTSAALGLLLALRLLPWGLASSLLTRQKSVRLADDAALGTARWSGWADLRSAAKPGWPKPGNAPGIVVGKLGGKILTLYPRPPEIVNRHVLVIGASGTGKSSGYVVPNIFAAVQAGQSIVVTDPKAELVAKTGTWLEAQGYAVQIFAPGQTIGHAWNPLAAAQTDADIDLLAAALLQSRVGGGSDVFFRAAEEYLLRLHMHAVLAHPGLQDHERTLPAVLANLSRLDDKALAAFVTASGSQVAKDTLTIYQHKIGKHTPDLGVASKLSALAKAAINITPAYGAGIDMSMIRQQKTALFCVLPVGDDTYTGLLAAFYALLFRQLCSSSDRARHGVRLILDEFANLGVIPGFCQQLAVARGYGVDISVILQSIDQLDTLYGQSEARTIASNCGTHIVLGVNDVTSATHYSKMLGETAVRQRRDRHIQDNLVSRRERSEDSIRRHLLNPDEVRRLAGQGEGIALAGAHTVRFRRLDFYADKLYKGMSQQAYVLPSLTLGGPPPPPPPGPPVDIDDAWF